MTSSPLYGLVLAGGRSTRMGTDKGLLHYHAQPQRDHVAGLLTPLCEKVFLSLNQDQAITASTNVIIDEFPDAGPLGGIWSAMRQHPQVAWLVVACDMPFLNKQTLRCLVQHRNTTQQATVFQHPDTGHIEPLVSIWEPAIYQYTEQCFKKSKQSPQQLLATATVQIVHPSDAMFFQNVNNIEAFEEAIITIKSNLASDITI